MNKKYISILGLFLLASCQNTPSDQYQSLPLTEAELLSNKWQSLQRFPPLYPIENARAGKEGCASVEYVITPENEVKNVKVIASTNKYFAKQAKLNVKKWKWSELPKGVLTAPVKTTTQFQFCLETGDGHCEQDDILTNNQCTGRDVIFSTGYRIKKRG